MPLRYVVKQRRKREKSPPIRQTYKFFVIFNVHSFFDDDGRFDQLGYDEKR